MFAYFISALALAGALQAMGNGRRNTIGGLIVRQGPNGQREAYLVRSRKVVQDDEAAAFVVEKFVNSAHKVPTLPERELKYRSCYTFSIGRYSYYYYRLV